MNLCHHCNLHLVGMNIVRLSSLMYQILFISSLYIIITIQKLLTIFQIHYHLLLLIVFIALIWTWLRIEFTLSVKVSLSCDFRKVRDLTCMVGGEAGRLMLDWNLLLFLRVLTVSSICHSTMNIVSNTLLVSVGLVLWLLLNIVSILLIPILRLHYIIIIYMFILVQSLFLSSVMSIVNLVGDLRVIASVAVHLVRALDHVNVLMVARDVVGLEVVFFFEDVDVFVGCHDVGMGHRIIKILFIITDILRSRLKNILHLRFQLLLLLNLFLLCDFLLSLFSLSHAFFHLSFVFVFYW